MLPAGRLVTRLDTREELQDASPAGPLSSWEEWEEAGGISEDYSSRRFWQGRGGGGGEGAFTTAHHGGHSGGGRHAGSPHTNRTPSKRKEHHEVDRGWRLGWLLGTIDLIMFTAYTEAYTYIELSLSLLTTGVWPTAG